LTPLQAARGHLAKAQEFLSEAKSALANGHVNAATSNAIIAGINAKDAICLVLVGKTSKADDHRQAVAELKKAGKIGADLAATLDRLLKPKTKSQYQSLSMVIKDAEAAVNQAVRLVEEAERVVPARESEGPHR
jgi:HEPN domain-containing protein